MPNLSDFEGPAQMYDVARPTEGEEDVQRSLQILQQQIDRLNDMSTRQAAQGKAAETPGPISSLKFKADGTVDVLGLSFDQFQNYIGAQRFQQEALGGFAIEAQKLEQQQTRAEGQPWQQLATALSANLAMAPDMPGWVQGLGRTAAQLNPTVEQLRAQRLGVLAKGSDIAGKSAALQVAQQRNLLEAAQIEALTAQRTAIATRQGREDLDTDIKNFMQPFVTAAEARTPPPPFEQFATVMKTRIPNVTEAQIVSEYAKVEAIAAGRKLEHTEEQKAIANQRKETAIEIAKALSPILIARDQAMHKEANEAIEIAAQDLAKGGLSSLREIASFRGDQRIRLFARVKELNPNFSTSELNRKISMEQAFTVGKDGQGLQSFDTFLQHAGEVKDALNSLYLSGSPAFNKPLNWMRRNMTGSPELAKLEVSLEPVKKEFEKFLLNQQALYAEDRKEAEKLVNSSLTPAQLLAAINQMGKTAKDRYTAMNQRYKRVMKQDIQHPFAPEALLAAGKIGIELSPPVESKPVSGNVVNVTEEELRKMGFK